MKKLIPYGQHYLDKADRKAVDKVLRSNSITQGPLIEKFEKKIAKYVNSKYAVAVSSCTAGMHLSLLACGIDKNKKVLTSPITFVSTANVIKFCNAKVDFIDIDKKTLNISLDILKKKFLDKKKKIDAIIPVHFAGNAVDTKKLRKILNKNTYIIEDGAHALGSRYKDGTMVGSCKFADVTVFSLHPVKTIACGEGGIITTNNKDLYIKLLRLRSHGINKLDDKFLNKKNAFTDKKINPWYYEMQELGYHYRLTEIQAALGISQMNKINKFLNKRRKIAKIYTAYFLKKSNQINFETANHFDIKLSSNHLFVIKLDIDKIIKSRAQIMNELKEKGILTQVHYIPVPTHPYYSKEKKFSNISNALKYYNSCLSVPIYYTLSVNEQKFVINQLENIIK